MAGPRTPVPYGVAVDVMRANSDELERLREFKRRALDLASSHLEALNLFYLDRDVKPLGALAGGPVIVGGFAVCRRPLSSRVDG